MNERIKELMQQALQSHYGDPSTPMVREKALELVSGWGEKFAAVDRSVIALKEIP